MWPGDVLSKVGQDLRFSCFIVSATRSTNHCCIVLTCAKELKRAARRTACVKKWRVRGMKKSRDKKVKGGADTDTSKKVSSTEGYDWNPGLSKVKVITRSDVER